MRDQYTLNLEAYDTGNPPLAAVTKVLVDVPLNTPPKVLPYFYLSIYENQDPGTLVGNVSAFDPDVKESSKERLHYTFNASGNCTAFIIPVHMAQIRLSALDIIYITSFKPNVVICILQQPVLNKA